MIRRKKVKNAKLVSRPIVVGYDVYVHLDSASRVSYGGIYVRVKTWARANEIATKIVAGIPIKYTEGEKSLYIGESTPVRYATIIPIEKIEWVEEK